MVRNYKRKTNRSTTYTKDQLREATEDVKSGRRTSYQASIFYKIPRMTIMDRVKHRHGFKSSTLGKATTFPEVMELKIAANLRVMEKYGFGLSRKEVIQLVGDFVKTNNIKTSFKNNIPGSDWFAGFAKRHNLTIKKPQPVEYARKKMCDPFIIYPYFDLLEKTIKTLGIENRPECIWNLDETSFCHDPSRVKVVGQKGVAATRTISSPGRDNTSVLMAASADGEKAPPLIIFKGKNVWSEWTARRDKESDVVYAATKNGWMEATVFENYFVKTFLKQVANRRPILLIFDGHSTHVTLKLIEEALKENITILKLPPHTSHMLQPMDLSVFKTFKYSWDEELIKWQRLNVGLKLPKKIFSEMIINIWENIDKEIIINGFKKGGIYPIDKKIIPRSKFDPASMSRWEMYNIAHSQNQPTVILATTAANSHSDALETDLDTRGQISEESNRAIEAENVSHILTPNIEVVDNELTVSEIAPQEITSMSSDNPFKSTNNPYVEKSDTGRILEEWIGTITPGIESYAHNSMLSPNNVVSVNNQLAVPETIPREIISVTPQSPPASQQISNPIDAIIESDIGPIPENGIAPIILDNLSAIHSKASQMTAQESTFLTLSEQPSTSSTVLQVSNILNASVSSFENLLLSTINRGEQIKVRKTKVASGAEVITHIDVIKRLKLQKQEEEENRLNKLKRASEKNLKKGHSTVKQNKSAPAKSQKKSIKRKGRKWRHEKVITSSSSEADDSFSLQSSGGSFFYFSDDSFCSDNERENDANLENVYKSFDHSLLWKIGDWLLAKFTTKKTIKHFVGKVIEINSDERKPIVQFLRAKTSSSDVSPEFIYPTVEDISQIYTQDIICILPKPTTGRRGQLTFNFIFSQYNIQ